jgi:predicted phosphodiesterase
MSLKSILIVPDVHRPYHDKRAWELLMKVGKDLKPDTLVVMGDFADCASISKYSKDPSRLIRLPEEIADVKAGLRDLQSLKAKRKVFCLGNHEQRVETYLRDTAPELFGIVTIDSLFELQANKWEVVPYKHDIRIGKLFFTHDVGSTGRNSTQKAIDAYNSSVVIGHSHRLNYLVEGNAKGEKKVAAQFGWLGDASKIDYMHQLAVKTGWALGFGLGYINDKTGVVYLTPIPIVGYSCVVNGRLFIA